MTRIVAVEAIPYALPFREPYVTARGTLTRREMVLLRLRGEDGEVGLGEAVPLSLRGGAGLERVVAELKTLGDLDAPTEPALRTQATSLSPPARCAIHIALLDLSARRSPGKVSQLFPDSGKNCDINDAWGERSVRCNATLVAGAPEEVAEQARRWAAEGFSTFKLKLGTGQDVEQVEAVREAVGPAARIRVDANAAWTADEARGLLGALEPFGIELVEQPVATLEEMAALAAETSIRLAADESVASLGDAKRAVELGACACTGVKLSKVGGPEQAAAIAAVLPAYVTSALDGPVGIAAAAHLALALGDGGDLAHGLATQRLFAATIAAVGCELVGDELHLPPGPGLGVEIDEDSLQAHRI